jgi:hypothetical protein
MYRPMKPATAPPEIAPQQREQRYWPQQSRTVHPSDAEKKVEVDGGSDQAIDSIRVERRGMRTMVMPRRRDVRSIRIRSNELLPFRTRRRQDHEPQHISRAFIEARPQITPMPIPKRPWTARDCLKVRMKSELRERTTTSRRSMTVSNALKKSMSHKLGRIIQRKGDPKSSNSGLDCSTLTGQRRGWGEMGRLGPRQLYFWCVFILSDHTQLSTRLAYEYISPTIPTLPRTLDFAQCS